MQSLKQRALRSLRMGGVYAAATIPVGLGATLLSIALVEASHHALPREMRGDIALLVNLAPASATGFAMYFSLARWAARREMLARGIVGHVLRAWPLYVVTSWLGILLMPSIVQGRLHGFDQLLLWPWLACLGGLAGDTLAAWFDWPPARRPVAVLVVISIAGGVVIYTVAWSRRVPTSPMFATIGLPGPRADAGRRCGHMYTRPAWHSLPTREIACIGPLRPPPHSYVGGRPEATVDAYNRRVTHAGRSWAIGDSASWDRVRDSVRIALERRGGAPWTCGRTNRHHLDHIRAIVYWRFPGYMVRLSAYSYIPGTPEARRATWLLQLDAYPGAAPECEFARRRGAARGRR